MRKTLLGHHGGTLDPAVRYSEDWVHALDLERYRPRDWPSVAVFQGVGGRLDKVLLEQHAHGLIILMSELTNQTQTFWRKRIRREREHYLQSVTLSKDLKGPTTAMGKVIHYPKDSQVVEVRPK